MMRSERWGLRAGVAGLWFLSGCYDGMDGPSPAGPDGSGASTSVSVSSSVGDEDGPTRTGGDPSTATVTTPGSTSAESGSGDDPDSGSGSESGSTTGPEVARGTLEIYWVDVEGGAATILLTPNGELVLVDTGNPGNRDANRIEHVVEDVIGADHIDVCIVTHYDADHVGGVPDLAERVPIDEFWDHGEIANACGGDCPVLWDEYLGVAQGNRTIIEAGEVRDVDGVQLHFVSAHGELIGDPLPGAGGANPACEGASSMPPSDDENAMSLGFVARFGAFDFLDLADLYWFQEDVLVCPDNLIGSVELYQTTHHGLTSSGAPQMVHGVEPLVVVMNNGPTKGGSEQAYDGVASAPSDPDLWQLHRAVDNDDQHNTAQDRIANLQTGSDDDAHWVRATIDGPTGMVTMYNSRNGHEVSYMSR